MYGIPLDERWTYVDGAWIEPVCVASGRRAVRPAYWVKEVLPQGAVRPDPLVWVGLTLAVEAAE